MAKTKKGGKKGKGSQKNKNDDSDSDALVSDDGDFDPKNPFGDDEIESFHTSRDKILLNNLNPKNKNAFHYSSDEEEVMAFEGEDDDEGEEDDDDDDEDDEDKYGGEDMDDDGISRSWGQKKSAYYSGNKIENEEDAILEEEEAKILQAKMMKQLDNSDFGLEAFNISSAKKSLKTAAELAAGKLATVALGDSSTANKSIMDEENLEKIAKNLSKMSKKEKIGFLEQESPELFELIREFKSKTQELHEVLIPVFNCIKNGQLPHSNASDFIVNKTKLYLMYCCHLSFYFVLKSQRSSIENHPIIKNILQFRNLCKQISPIDEQLENEISAIIKTVSAGQQLYFAKSAPTTVKSKLKSKKTAQFRQSVEKSRTRNQNDDLVFDDDDDDDDDDEDDINFKEQLKLQSAKLAADAKNGKKVAEMDPEMKSLLSKRPIGYDIEKNKGLTPKRPKEQRNPRVKNKLKARKANIKHKSIVPKVRTETKRYGGEASGIRMGVVRGVKIK